MERYGVKCEVVIAISLSFSYLMPLVSLLCFTLFSACW